MWVSNKTYSRNNLQASFNFMALLVCDSSCLMMGQGGCLTLADCCPFYNIDGSCTTQCPANFAGTYSSNYTCGKCHGVCTCSYNNTHNLILWNFKSVADEFFSIVYTECNITCQQGYSVNSSCIGCDPVHICVTGDNPCQNGGTCEIGTSNNTDYTCSCDGNYVGQSCDSKWNSCCFLGLFFSILCSLWACLFCWIWGKLKLQHMQPCPHLCCW